MWSVIRGLITVIRRRRLAYGVYLVTGVALPRVAVSCRSALTAWGGARARLGRLTGSDSRVADAMKLYDLKLTGEHGPSAAPARASDVEALMNGVHGAGLTGLRYCFDEVVMCADGTARLRRGDRLRAHARRALVFQADRDTDRIAFNARFGGSILTEGTARRLLRERKATLPAGYRDYAPIDFGGGLTVGRFVSTDSGAGRWDFFNRHIVAPLVAGRRVLDLGSNNGSLPLMMLRAGARAVVAVEASPAIADFARLNAQILEWRDIRSYDLQVITGDMRLFVTEDLGEFDVVTAFCSLYYLPESDMAQIIARAAATDATLVLQANNAITNLPASGNDLRTLMARNGYPDVKVHEFPGFSRPLLVGTPRRIGRLAQADAVPQVAGVGGGA